MALYTLHSARGSEVLREECPLRPTLVSTSVEMMLFLPLSLWIKLQMDGLK